MINLRTFTQAELLQLLADCEKIKCLALMGIKPTEDERLAIVNPIRLSDELAILQNQIRHVLNTPDEEVRR